ncbi:MAG: nucleoside 2-deoxyribosyltransferase domain-containing protein [Planctomycetales bacterium]|nr:nucleoside 2-deoxyribosyltransferase domain-containing protein [Planctomycetales bacterium]
MYIEAPNRWDGLGASIFLAGGITDCGDWQIHIANRIAAACGETPLHVLNPRRADFPMGDPSAAEEQIQWEFQHLRLATAVAFWFCPPTLNPISLFEYGKHIVGSKPIFVGCDPLYARRDDVLIQTRLERPDLELVGTLDQLAEQVLAWHAG